MNRRDFSCSLALLGGLFASGAQAQGKAPQAGTDYLVLDQRVPVETAAGKVEVIEFFGYWCPHCNAFEPKLEEWARRLPKDVVLRRLPVAFRDDQVPLQRLFYAIEAMHKVDELHRKVFYAMHVEKKSFNSVDAIARWVEQQGVDKAKFLELYNSFSVVTQVSRSTRLLDAYKVSGVPALAVAGRYYVDGQLAGSMERALQVVDLLIDGARKGR